MDIEDEYMSEKQRVIENLEELIEDFMQGYTKRVPEYSRDSIALINQQDETIEYQKKTMEVYYERLQVLKKANTDRLKYIVNKNEEVTEAVKEILNSGLAVSNSEARRYFYQIKQLS